MSIEMKDLAAGPQAATIDRPMAGLRTARGPSEPKLPEDPATTAPTDGSSEMELILACLSVRPDGERVRALLQRHMVWERVVELAGRHCVATTFYSRARDLGRGGLPPAAVAGLRKQLCSRSLRSGALVPELHSLVEILTARGIPVLAFKGPTLG